jgi:DNA gyrase subunit A
MPTSGDRIKPITIEQEMKTAFLDYSMSVIVSRALPDVRDGLKPVHRRILYVMQQLGLQHNRSYRKCAGIVGEALGKYHPHGDQSVYDALVRMAQEWNLRYTLVDGQGNFGSIDGDNPAAYRYTEARMESIAAEMLADLDKNTVDMAENFDQSQLEPTVLPAGIPNLLVNGSYGIAVGMATSFPPHNLGEVIDATIHLIDDPEATSDDLMKHVKGPDFPTGGIICGTQGIREAYRTGRGRCTIRARVDTETDKKTGKDSLVVTEIPYQLNKTRLIENIAHLVHAKTVEGITDLRDESDKDGMRLVIEIRKGEEPQVVLNQLYKHTQLQANHSIIMLALVNNQPRVLSLRECIFYYVEHRVEIIERRTKFLLAKAEDRAHILEGLLKAIDFIDEVIAIIRGSADTDAARDNLIARFEFSIVQANAILAMRLRQLTGLEREVLQKEYEELLKEIERLRLILASRANLLAEVRKELLEVRKKYADPRRSVIAGDASDLSIEDLIADENMVVTVSNLGYIKRLPVSTYRKQRRGGRGISGMDTKEEDFVKDLFVASSHEYILFFTNRGRLYWRKVHELPKASRTARGRAIVNVLDLGEGERVTAYMNVREHDHEDRIVLMVTRQGVVKKTTLKAFSNVRLAGIIAMDLDKDDELVDVVMTSGNDNILIATRQGMAIRFPEKDVRPMGRTARGVIGIKLGKEDDEVIGVSLAHDDHTVLSVTENGYGKRTLVGEYRLQHRSGHGIINIKTTDRNGRVVAMLTVDDDDDIVLVATDGVVIRTSVSGLRTIGRNTAGVRVMKPQEGAIVSAVARALAEKKEAEVTDAAAASLEEEAMGEDDEDIRGEEAVGEDREDGLNEETARDEEE